MWFRRVNWTPKERPMKRLQNHGCMYVEGSSGCRVLCNMFSITKTVQQWCSGGRATYYCNGALLHVLDLFKTHFLCLTERYRLHAEADGIFSSCCITGRHRKSAICRYEVLKYLQLLCILYASMSADKTYLTLFGNHNVCTFLYFFWCYYQTRKWRNVLMQLKLWRRLNLFNCIVPFKNCSRAI